MSSGLYNAYGQLLSGNPSGDPFGFCGQAGCYTDPETGLSLMGQRYYDPGAGRFLTRDPSGYNGGVNLYDYTGNNPVNYFDASGYYRTAWGSFWGAAGRAAVGVVVGVVIAAGVVALAPVAGAFIGLSAGTMAIIGGAAAIAGFAYGGWQLGKALYSLGSGQEWSMDGNGAQMDDCEWPGLLGETVVNIGTMALGGAEGDGAADDSGAMEGEGEPNPCGCCLIGSTAVWMADGTTKRIDQVQVGDQVISRDPDSGQDTVETVTITYCLHEDTLITLSLEDPTTHVTSSIKATPDHAMYIQGKGWIEAGDLTAGEQIVTRTGSPLTITNLNWQRDETGKHPFTVYNLEVANDHTYFAGDYCGGLWVHNAAETNCGKFPTRDDAIAAAAEKAGVNEPFETESTAMYGKDYPNSRGPNGEPYYEVDVTDGENEATFRDDTWGHTFEDENPPRVMDPHLNYEPPGFNYHFYYDK